MGRYIDAVPQYFDGAGNPLVNGKLTFYKAGTTSLLKTYADAESTILNTNPVKLDAAGRTPDIYFDGAARVVLTSDNIETCEYGKQWFDRSPVFATNDDGVIPNDLEAVYSATLQEAVESTTAKEGDTVIISDRNGLFEAMVGQVNNEYNIIECTGVAGLSWVLRHNGTVTPEQWGISDSTITEADDSVGVQLLFDDPTVGRVNGDPERTYFFKLITTNKKRFTWDGGVFRFNRTRDTEINTYSWNGWPTPTPYSTGEEWLIRFTAPTSGDSGLLFKNIEVEGNGEPFATSAGYPNQYVKMFDIVSCRHITFDNVNIKRNNGNGLFAYNSEYINFVNGSILETVGLTGALTPFEQINLVASQNCTIKGNDFGGMTPNSCINTAGGFASVVDGSEVGGFVPFNSPDGVYTAYTYFGLATGETDTFHVIENNTCRSDIVDAAEAAGGGVLGRMITINSGRCFVKDNIVYDLTNKSQGGIGLGHDDTTTTVDPAYGRMASRTEVSGNIIFGYRKNVNAFGILNDGSEDCSVHNNEIYNNSKGITHARAATTSTYNDNWIFKNDLALSIADFASQSASHGIISLVKIHGNTCWGNLQDIVTANNTTYADLSIKGNDFTQTGSNALVQFDIFHGLLKWQDNEVVNNSTNIVGKLFTRGVGRHVEFSGGSIESLQDTSQDLFFFDGSSGDTIGRGSLTINDLKIDCPVGSFNRRVNIRRDNTKGLTISNPQMYNCKLLIQSKSGDINIDGGQIETQGATDECITLALADGTNPRLAQISNMSFPKSGATTPMKLQVSGGGGHIVVNSCTTKEAKEVTDRGNTAEYRNNNCWKIVAGVLTASRP